MMESGLGKKDDIDSYSDAVELCVALDPKISIALVDYDQIEVRIWPFCSALDTAEYEDPTTPESGGKGFYDCR